MSRPAGERRCSARTSGRRRRWARRLRAAALALCLALARRASWASEAPAASGSAPPQGSTTESASEDFAEASEVDASGERRAATTSKKARADTDSSTQSDPPLPPGDGKRPLPAYRPVPRHPASVAWWVPRLVLAPVHVAGDMLGRPTALLVAAAEKHHWVRRLHDFFTFGERDQLGLFPVAYVDTGFRSTLGAYFFWREGGEQGSLRLRATTGGPGHWDARASWAVPAEPGWQLSVRASERDDRVFYGLGRGSESQPLRHGERFIGAELEQRFPLAPRLSAAGRLAQEWWRFDPASGVGEVSLAAAIDGGRLPPPPALEGGVAAMAMGLDVEFDSRAGRLMREPRSAADYLHVGGSGLALHADVTAHFGTRRTRAHSEDPPRVPAWVSYGGRATGTWDVSGTQRRLELELHGELTDPLPGAPEVPFTHAASLGGSRPLRGFGARRFVDRSAVAGTLRYRWPVWSALDGTLHAAAGNVFGPRLRGFALDELRGSFGVGMASASSGDPGLELLLAFGTRPFDEGAAIESTRFAAGTTFSF